MSYIVGSISFCLSRIGTSEASPSPPWPTMLLRFVLFSLRLGTAVIHFLSSYCAPCGLGHNVPLIRCFDFGAIYIVCLFTSYDSPLIFFSSLLPCLSPLLLRPIFSFENRPAPFPGRMCRKRPLGPIVFFVLILCCQSSLLLYVHA